MTEKSLKTDDIYGLKVDGIQINKEIMTVYRSCLRRKKSLMNVNMFLLDKNDLNIVELRQAVG